MRFRRRGRRVELTADAAESAMVADWAAGLLQLLGNDATEDPTDPLEALVGLSAGDPVRPTDPALARLFPDGYRQDDDAASEFRRYTESDLRRGKLEAAKVVRATVPPGGGTVVLDRPQADAWLGWFNDMRLVIGTRLGIDQVDATDDDIDDDRGDPGRAAYQWFTYLQYDLLKALD